MSKENGVSEMKIELRKVLRKCPHNAAIESGEKKERRIYDYEVRFNGEFLAQWRKTGFGNGYDLWTAGMESQIRDKSRRFAHVYSAKNAERLEAVALVAFNAGHIPTREDIAAMIAQAESDKKQRDEQNKEQARKAQIECAAPDLLAACEAAFVAMMLGPDSQEYPQAILTLKSAITKAKDAKL